ncbi:GUN4 domain-containing protein [Nostoc sp. CCCryo 231-06]|nr:GUN4 domain-containing protein [Nostoc sp. CCCryo 231-06]
MWVLLVIHWGELRSLIAKLVEADIPVIPVLLPQVQGIPDDLDFLKQLNWVSFANGLDDTKALDNLVWGITQKKPIIEVQADNLASERRIDYTRLRNLLAAKNWEEADEETYQVMIMPIGKKHGDYITSNELLNFSCTDLRTIDRLWVKYSSGHFGFSVQKEIYLSVGGKADGKYYKKAWEKFGNRVEWRMIDSWKYDRNEFIFDISLAPKGHLPYKSIKYRMEMLSSGDGYGGGFHIIEVGAVGLFFHMETCKM